MFLDRKTQYIKLSVLSELIYRLNAILIKIPANNFVATDKQILKFTERGKRLRITNKLLKEKKNLEDYQYLTSKRTEKLR